MNARFRATKPRYLPTLWFAGLALVLAPDGAPATMPSAGVLVEEVAPASAGHEAGIQPGDVILAWFPGSNAPANPFPAGGTIDSPFDLAQVETEQAPRGTVTLIGKHGEREVSWRLAPGPWGLSVRPGLSANLLSLYEEGKRQLGVKNAAGAAEEWRRSAAKAGAPDGGTAPWLLSRAARAFAESRAWEAADAAYAEAIEMAQSRAPAVAAHLLREWGESLRERSEWDAAEECFHEALAQDRKLTSESLAIARTLHGLGMVALLRGDVAAADEHFRRGLAMRETLAPDSLDVAASLHRLALVARRRGDIATMEDQLQRALAIRERLVPGSAEVASTVNNLGLVALARWDLAAAAERFRRASVLWERLAPHSLDFASSLNNLAIVATGQGDLARADEFFQRALALREELSPGSLNVAGTLNNLGLVAKERGDLARAEEYLRRSLVIKEKLAPGSLEVARTQGNLGDVTLERGDLLAAEDHSRRCLEIEGRLAPGSATEATALHRLASVYRRTGRLGLADELFRRALDALESQKARVGGAEETRSDYAAKYSVLYRDCIEALVELGRPEEAFHVLERSRARSLLTMLAERDLLLSGDLPAELARDRTRLEGEYDQTQAALARLRPGNDGQEIEKLLAHLRALRDQREEMTSRIRRASPRLASLKYPQPLDSAAARRSLDQGTVLLSYSVGAEKTLLFVIESDGQGAGGASGIAVRTISVGEKDLRAKVEALRTAVTAKRRFDPNVRATLAQRAGELYDLLIRPAEAHVAASRRVLVSPDGPLHMLPFAALVRHSSSGGTPARTHYLAEWKPLHIVNSATLYAELKSSRKAPAAEGGVLVAFGDPLYPPLPKDKAATIVNEELRSAVMQGWEFVPLPTTRAEVEAIGRLYAGSASLYLGREATEEKVKALSRNVRRIHFACHAYLDERVPLNSALALTIRGQAGEGEDNGLLQVWEIFEHVRIDADLVTLSACSTALGKESGGEGLVGLTRAFHYAGARSVLASLWSVADESTADLMKRFYGYLKAGKPKDEALRAAQVDLIRYRNSHAHPFYWASFQLFGDWR